LSGADLLWRPAEVQHLCSRSCASSADADPAGASKPGRPSDYGELLALYRDVRGNLIDAFSNTADDLPVWTSLDSKPHCGFCAAARGHSRISAVCSGGNPARR
jgi:hypothetical protein